MSPERETTAPKGGHLHDLLAGEINPNDSPAKAVCPLACQPALCSTWRCPVPLDVALDMALVDIAKASTKAVLE